jgi:hypothetical protein
VTGSTARGTCDRSHAVKTGAVTTVAGIEIGGSPVAKPWCAERIDSRNAAESGRDLQNPRMRRTGSVADFTSGIGTVDEPAQLHIKARIAARSAEGVVGVALLAENQVGLGRRAVIVRIRPAEGVAGDAVTQRAVETARRAGGKCGYDLGAQVAPPGMAEGTGGGIKTSRIVDGVGMGGRRIGTPGKRRMGRINRSTIAHVASAVGTACRKTADPGYTPGKISTVTGTATGETGAGPRL